MTTTNFSQLLGNPNALLPGQKGKTFIGETFDLGSEIPYESATLVTGSVAANATSITVTAGTSVDLQEGTILAFKANWTDVSIIDSFTDYFVVSAFTAAGATSIPIEATPQTAAGDEEIRIFSKFPYYSANSVTINNQPEIISDNVQSNGLFDQKATISQTASIDTSGPRVDNDPGRAALEAVDGQGKRVVVMHLRPENRGGFVGVGVIGELTETSNKNEFVQVTANFDVSGQLIRLKAQAA